MAIADGRAPNPLKQLAAGARCTWFLPSASPPAARKRWIAGLLNPVGAVTVDSGAEEALMHGRSLLPAGVVAVSGTFERGDAVGVSAASGREMGRGPVRYSSAATTPLPSDHTRTIKASPAQ